jgi:hypothetical protein
VARILQVSGTGMSFWLNRNQKKYVNLLVNVIGNHAHNVNILDGSIHTVGTGHNSENGPF